MTLPVQYVLTDHTKTKIPERKNIAPNVRCLQDSPVCSGQCLNQKYDHFPKFLSTKEEADKLLASFWYGLGTLSRNSKDGVTVVLHQKGML